MAEIEDLYRQWQGCGSAGKKKKNRERLLREIWIFYHPRLQVFLSRTGAEREDQASEILLRAFESLENYNPDYAFSTWIYRIARNSQIDRYRRASPVLVEWDEAVHSTGEEGETPESLMLRETEKELLAEAMASLDRADRQLLYLAYFEGMTYGEISRTIGRPVGTVKYEMHRIRRLLKAKLKEDFCDEAE
jgi:RNA polymerase sigma-70 factor, ECF subfamily